MAKNIYALLILGVLGIASVIVASSTTTTLDRPRGYDTATNSFVEDLTAQDAIDGGAAATNTVFQASAVGSDGTIYTAFAKDSDSAGTATHVYLGRNTGTSFEVWDHDTKTWTTTLANGDPISGVLGVNTDIDAAPGIAVDSNGNVYIAYVRDTPAGDDESLFLTKYDASSNDVYMWDDGATSLTNDLSAPTATTDGIGNNQAAHDAEAASPAIAIDSNNDVYIAYIQQADGGDNERLWLSKFDVSATDVLIWDEGATSFTNVLSAPTAITDSAGLTFANQDAAIVAPAIAIDSNDDVYIAFVHDSLTAANERVFLNKFDVSATDLLVWDDGATSFTNVLSAPNAETDSVGVNITNQQAAVLSPAIAVDSNDDVYVSYVQQGATGASNKVWLSKFDLSATDVLIWDDGATSLTNVLTAPAAATDSIGNNAAAGALTNASPSIVIDSNDDVWVATNTDYAAGDDPGILLTQFDLSATDVFVWDDGATSLTNDLTTLVDTDSIALNATAAIDAAGAPSIALGADGDIYIAYIHEESAAGNNHAWISKFDVSATDAFIWDSGATSLTNALNAPTEEADSIDRGVDADESSAPTIHASANGVYVMYLQENAGNDTHLQSVRFGFGTTTTTAGRRSSSGTCLIGDSASSLMMMIMLAGLGATVAFSFKRKEAN